MSFKDTCSFYAKPALISSLICMFVCILISFPIYFSGYPKRVLLNQSLHSIDAEIVHTRYKKILHEETTCKDIADRVVCTTDQWYTYDHYLTFQYTPDCLIVADCQTQEYEMFWLSSRIKQLSYEYEVGHHLTLMLNICPYFPLDNVEQDICKRHKFVTPLYREPVNANAMMISGIIFFVFLGIVSLICIFCSTYLLTEYCKSHSFASVLISKQTNQIVINEFNPNNKVSTASSHYDLPSYEEAVRESNIRHSYVNNL